MENNILKDIIKFSKMLKGCKLKNDIITNKSDFITRIDAYFGTTRFQSIIIVAVFEFNAEDNKPNQSDLAKYFKCSSIELFVYKIELDSLLEKGIFTDGFSLFNRNRGYHITEEFRKAIIENRPYRVKVKKIMTPIEICEHIRDLVNMNDPKNNGFSRLYQEVREVLRLYKETEFVKYISKIKICNQDKIAYLYVIAENLNGYQSCDVSKFSNDIFETKREQILYEKSIYDKSSDLIKNKLIELNDESFFSNASVSLTKQSSQELESFDIPIRLKLKEKKISLIQPSDIKKQKMFYNIYANTELNSITQSLKPLKHKQITRALKTEGFRTGVCTLFYGPPGTGKTEGVYQIAKTTGRAIWKVDLSELKSMWFGESQKLIKTLFEDYKDLTTREKRVPILLLNEADAILGKRNALTSSSTDKAENAIQNIFLDCLEDFEGILFATTNLEESLDPAFERRFLFKVCFKQPTVEIRSKIWRSKLKGLNKLLADYLATNYNFSGGEIENVIRKYKMSRVIDPSTTMQSKIIAICDSEKLSPKTKRGVIGF